MGFFNFFKQPEKQKGSSNNYIILRITYIFEKSLNNLYSIIFTEFSENRDYCKYDRYASGKDTIHSDWWKTNNILCRIRSEEDANIAMG